MNDASHTRALREGARFNGLEALGTARTRRAQLVGPNSSMGVGRRGVYMEARRVLQVRLGTLAWAAQAL